jgi:RND superfamily putative drug exporter
MKTPDDLAEPGHDLTGSDRHAASMHHDGGTMRTNQGTNDGGALARFAGWCYDHRRRVLALWVLAVVGFGILGQAAGGSLLKTFDLPGSDAAKAFHILDRDFHRPGDTGQLVWRSRSGAAPTDATVRDVVQPVIDDLGRQPHIASIASPFDPDPANQRFVSSAKGVAYAEIQFDQRANDVDIKEASHLRDLVAKANTKGVQIELGGPMFVDQTMPASEAIGILAAIVILLVAFGSLLAMGLPIMTALAGISVGLALVEVLAHLYDVPSFAPQVTAMIGIGVGIDYALFIVTRYRGALHEGRSPRDAVVHAINTSGRAVLFAGCTVVISLLGLFVVGLSFIRGMATGAALAVLIVMLASVTLLPAVLGFVGHTIDKFALPSAKRVDTPENSMWVRWSRTLQRRPWVAALAGVVVLLVLCIPVVSLRLGVADAGNDPTSQTTRRAYDLLAEGFGPGSSGPLLVVAEVGTDAQRAGIQKLAAVLPSVPGVRQVSPVVLNQAGTAALINVEPTGSPQDESTTRLVHHLRDDVVPASTAGTGLHAYVGGQTSIGIDLADQLGARLPWFFVAVLTLSFLLLLIVFRSLLVPLKAVIMNLLSIGAAYGVMIAVFQWGWLKDVFGVGKAGPIEAWIPMMLFAIVFGLSMDYEVFLLSRIKEDYDATGDNANAVAHGLALTARLITAAAAIMICIFGSFVVGDLRVLKMIGFGLAVAVFIDATIVRLVLVPATMELLGDRNWWLPKRLGWIPRLDVEGNRAEPVA